MTKDAPIGAIPEDERIPMAAKSKNSHFTWCGKEGYYAVMCTSGELSIGGGPRPDEPGVHTFAFSWTPGEAYYFTNYWYALAYSLRIKHARRAK